MCTDFMIDKNFTTLIDYTLIHGGDTSGIRFFVQNPESGLKITGEDNRRVFPTMRKNTFITVFYGKILVLAGLLPGRSSRIQSLPREKPEKKESYMV